MTRIIGGSAGGRRLRTPPGGRTRPTSDRVREALFSSIQSAFGSLRGLGFLDLYAGSGAVGLEASSRGAERVTLIEAHQPTARLIQANARDLGLDVHVISATVSTGLKMLAEGLADHSAGSHRGFEIVFADPPYDTVDQLDDDLHVLADSGVLAGGASVIVERSGRAVEPSWPTGWKLERTKKYGETRLWYLLVAPEQS